MKSGHTVVEVGHTWKLMWTSLLIIGSDMLALTIKVNCACPCTCHITAWVIFMYMSLDMYMYMSVPDVLRFCF